MKTITCIWALTTLAILVGSLCASTVVHPDASLILERGKDCRSSCTARQSDGEPFALSFNSYREGSHTYINLQIGGREFRGLMISRRLITDGSLHFYQFQFPQHTLYGLISHSSTKNMDIHYFIRSDGGFSYLGEFPSLSYDTQSGLFVGFFLSSAMEDSTHYYRLQDDRLTEEDFCPANERKPGNLCG